MSNKDVRIRIKSYGIKMYKPDRHTNKMRGYEIFQWNYDVIIVLEWGMSGMLK